MTARWLVFGPDFLTAIFKAQQLDQPTELARIF
jgi:hypothetical protein